MSFIRRIVPLVLLLAAVAMVPGPASAHTEIDMLGTLNLPPIATAEVGHPTTFVNMEPADYPVVMGRHDVSPDHELGHTPNFWPFPKTSPVIQPGGRWTWTPSASDRGKVYVYKCSVHPNHQRGILIVQ